jgi:cell division protease FtsH
MNDLAKNLLLWVIVAVVLMVVFQAFGPRAAGSETLAYDQFVQQVQSDRIKEVKIGEDHSTISGERKDGSKFTTYSPGDKDLVNDLITHKVAIEQAPPQNGPSLLYILINVLPWLLFVGIWIYFMRQMQQGGSKGAMSFGRSRAKLQGEDQVKVTLADVAGCDEAKEEVGELVEFLRDPGRFQKLGGKIPRGVLMVGPRAPARPCWPAPSPAKPRCLSSAFPVPTSSRCSSASAPAACATCSTRARSTRLASSSSTRSTRSAAIAVPAWAAVTTSASRR